jgi:hypothetical protein
VPDVTNLPQTIIRSSEEGDQIIINFIPLPPEKRADWEQAMRLITEIIIEIINQRGAGGENKNNDKETERTTT